MSAEQRLDRLYPALSAKERALMVLHSGKAEEPPDRAIYTTAPQEQRWAFNRLIRLMNVCNVELASVLFVLREQISGLEMKYAWLETVHMWAVDAAALRCLIVAPGKKPITASEAQATIHALLDQAPVPLATPVDLASPIVRPTDHRFGSDLERALVISIRRLVQQHWIEVRAIEIGIEEVVEEFDGEDPLRPDTRQILDDCLRRCSHLRDEMRDYGEFHLAEPSDDDVGQIRALIEKVAQG